jgi:acetoin utilization deacetylase AcuC-like enzyme
MAGGFCFLNNTAIATEQLLKLFPRAAILDVDVHHGNGTQSIFYRRSDVFTVSVHADPHDFYPFFWGHAQERGEDAGEGFNFNIPLPLGTDDSPWLAAIDRALDRIALYAPDVLVVALGLDAARSDPLQGMRISPEGFAALGERLRGWQKPLLLVQEGGYLGPELASNLKAFLSALGD